MNQHRFKRCNRGRSVRSVLTVIAVYGLAPTPVRADIDDDLLRYEKQIEFLVNKTALVQREYLGFTEKTGNTKRFEQRLNDGQSLMLLKDYVRAAIVLHNLVENKRYQKHAGYIDAVYNLGEALFYNKNYIDARKYYRIALESTKANRAYRKTAMVRLMQIALRIKEFDKVDSYRNRLKKEGAVSPEAEYLWGKTLFSRNRLQEAAKAFSSLKSQEPFYLQSRYFMGVILVRQRQHKEALATFSDLVTQQAKSAQESQVIELGHLAKGRLLHDLGREREALDAFQSVEHTSINFDDALFEICWTYVQMAEKAENPEDRDTYFLEAARTLEILEVSTPNSASVPRANLLKGHIFEKMGKYGEAAEAFARISKSYATVKRELDDLVASHEDPVQYFNEVAGRNLDSFDLSTYLPPVAVRWMSRHNEMNAALGVMKDLENGRKFITEARSLLAKLDSLLANEKDRINLFPLLLEGAQRTNEIENARVIQERNLSRLEERVVMEHVSDKERKEFQSAIRQREELEIRIDGLPTTRQDTATREERIRSRIVVLEQAVYQSSIGLKGMKAQLSAMEDWIRQNTKQLEGREEAVRDFREEIRRGWAMANQLQNDLDALANQLATEKARAGMDSQAQTKETLLRERYLQALSRERMLSEQIHDRLGAEGTAQVLRINQMRLQSQKLHRSLDKINQSLADRVRMESQKLQQQASKEKKNLDQFERALAKLEKESENLAGEVAFSALQEVRQKFHRLVLDADVGILDVAWSRKMETTRKISDLTRKQGKERKRLHNEFKDVLKEVD